MSSQVSFPEYKGFTLISFQTDESCRPKQLWLLMRHGTRLPSDSGLEAIRVKLPQLIKEVQGRV